MFRRNQNIFTRICTGHISRRKDKQTIFIVKHFELISDAKNEYLIVKKEPLSLNLSMLNPNKISESSSQFNHKHFKTRFFIFCCDFNSTFVFMAKMKKKIIVAM